MKHTPGKWRVSDGAVLSEKINAYGNWIIASCQRERTEEDEANLHLIASAPELLEACKMALSCMAPEDNDITARELRAVIAKAEGRDEG